MIAGFQWKVNTLCLCSLKLVRKKITFIYVIFNSIHAQVSMNMREHYDFNEHIHKKKKKSAIKNQNTGQWLRLLLF